MEKTYTVYVLQSEQNGSFYKMKLWPTSLLLIWLKCLPEIESV
jgi:hypothetical protein